MLHYTNSQRECYFVAHLLIGFSLLLFMLLETSCNNDSITDVERIAGSYEATTFIEPGQLDGGVDILANGGSLKVTLTSDFEVKGNLVIPEDILSNFSTGDRNFYGNFSLADDTVNISGTNTFLDNEPFLFIAKDTRLETPDYAGRWGLFKIILVKK